MTNEVTSTPCLMRVEGLHKRFGDQQVLAGVDLSIPEGMITFIVGPSGTGKSVLLKHMIGLLKPDEGHIYLDDLDIPTLSSMALNEVRKNFGVLFQNGALFDSFNVFDNVAFPLVEHARMKGGDIAQRVREKLAVVGLEGVEHKFPSELSGGMRKRVGLARAIALNPRIIFYDEPTTGLDPLMVEQIDELIRSTNESQKSSSVVISHDIPAMMEIADRAAVIYQGKILAFDAPHALVDHEDEFVRRFVRKGLAAKKHHEGR